MFNIFPKVFLLFFVLGGSLPLSGYASVGRVGVGVGGRSQAEAGENHILFVNQQFTPEKPNELCVWFSAIVWFLSPECESVCMNEWVYECFQLRMRLCLCVCVCDTFHR